MTQQPPPVYPPAQPQFQYSPQTPNMPVSKPPTNVFAIIALIGAFFFSLVGIIFGHIALSQIKRTGESGRGLALAGTIVGYVRLLLDALAVILFFVFAGVFGSLIAESTDQMVDQLDQFEQYESPDANGNSELQDAPWMGTENEAFCNALDNYDLSYDDEFAYYEELRAVTDDPEFTELIDAQLGMFEMDLDNLSEEEYREVLKQNELWSEAHTRKLDRCYAG
ncbi:MAG: DUF4190 domain-containing protein [Leucobacter sp.]